MNHVWRECGGLESEACHVNDEYSEELEVLEKVVHTHSTVIKADLTPQYSGLGMLLAQISLNTIDDCRSLIIEVEKF